MNTELLSILDKSTRQMLQQYIDKRKYAVLSIGIINQSKQEIFGFGNSLLEGKVSYKDIVYEIGSLTKVFTTSLLSLLVEKGVVYLDDSIGKYEQTLQIEHPVTLKHLSTHTSGLPSVSLIKTIMNRFDKKTYRDPYCLFDVQEAITYLSRVSPDRVGKVFRYSNEGMGLLGRYLAQKLGTDLEKALLEFICQPLGMQDTAIRLSPDQRNRLVPGYAGKDVNQPELAMKVFEGAGALRSTVTDILQFLSVYMGICADHPMSKPFQVTQQEHISQGKNFGVGLGWIIDKRNGIIWHNGSTHGYSSFLGCDPCNSIGVVILSNYRPRLMDDTLNRIGYEILTQIRENRGTAASPSS